MRNYPKVLLISPFKNEGLRVGQYLSPPFGLYRIASYLAKKLGVKIEIYDPDLQGIHGLPLLLKQEKFDIIGFSLLQPTLKNDMPLINYISKISPNALLIAGGQGAAFNVDFLMNNSPLDIIVKGFGEFPFEGIINNFQNPGSLVERFKDIRGISIKTEDKVHNTLPSQPYTEEQFREISFAFDFEKVPYESYWDFMENIYTEEHLKIMKNENMIRTIRFVTSSHCPLGCSFCSSTNFLDNATCKRQRVISLKAEEVLELIKKARQVHPAVKAFYFCDDDFLGDKKRVEKLCDLLEDNSEFKDITFFCLSRPDRVDSKLLEKMHRSNFHFIIYGVDSFSNKIIEDMNKKVFAEDKKKLMVDSIGKTIDAGIVPLMNIILFYPTVSVADVIETIETSIDMIRKGARLTTYAYVEFYPGSNISNSKNLEYIYESFDVEGKNIELPKLILPHSSEMKELAQKSIRLRDILIPEILEKYQWKGIVPHPLYGLALFLAVYKILNLDCSKINSLIDKLMLQDAIAPGLEIKTMEKNGIKI